MRSKRPQSTGTINRSLRIESFHSSSLVRNTRLAFRVLPRTREEHSRHCPALLSASASFNCESWYVINACGDSPELLARCLSRCGASNHRSSFARFVSCINQPDINERKRNNETKRYYKGGRAKIIPHYRDTSLG